MLDRKAFIFDRFTKLDLCKSLGLKPEYYGEVKSVRDPIESLKIEDYKQNRFRISKTGWAILLNKPDQIKDIKCSKPFVVNHNCYYSTLGLIIATGRTDMLNGCWNYDVDTVSKINSVIEYPFDTALRFYVEGKADIHVLKKLLDNRSKISRRSLKFIKLNNLSDLLGIPEAKKIEVKKDFIYYLIKGKINKAVNNLKSNSRNVYNGKILAKGCIMANSLKVTAFYLNYLRILFDELEVDVEDEPNSYLQLMLEEFKPWFNINEYLNCIRFVVYIRPYELSRKNKHGVTPLMLSTKTNREEIPKLLLELGADIDGSDNIGRSFAHYVCRYGNSDMLNLVVRYGAEQFGYTDNIGRTPIFYAAKYGKTEMVDILSNCHPCRTNDVYGVDWKYYTGYTDTINIFGHTWSDQINIRTSHILNGTDQDKGNIDELVSFFRRKYF